VWKIGIAMMDQKHSSPHDLRVVTDRDNGVVEAQRSVKRRQLLWKLKRRRAARSTQQTTTRNACKIAGETKKFSLRTRNVLANLFGIVRIFAIRSLDSLGAIQLSRP
jgi:hypothetical protein